ncbi:unnamed protein product [marine sediment metagenome]|uniref:Uncharacterized protein n=1 Tax=marine sediment metagenome TaxID=412755 RepID=X1RJS8_9ZZZZ
MEVYVVIGLYGAVISEVKGFLNKEKAEEFQADLDKEYGIVRDENGDYEHPKNDVLFYTLEVS